MTILVTVCFPTSEGDVAHNITLMDKFNVIFHMKHGLVYQFTTNLEMRQRLKLFTLKVPCAMHTYIWQTNSTFKNKSCLLA